MAETITQQRLVSLDAFRGMTIAGMVLVNNPGTWSSIYGPLKHAEWHGITPTDYVFPFFLFIVGVAIPISLGRRMAAGIDRGVHLKIFQRAGLIFALGLLMSMIPFFVFGETGLPQVVKLLIMIGFSAALFLYLANKKRLAAVAGGVSVLTVFVLWMAGTQFVWYDFGTMRIPGVLQRIAVCYLVVSLIFIHTTWKQQTLIGVLLLLGYWILMTAVPVPGCEIASVDSKACNMASFFDRVILGVDHMWKAGKVYDPEGILSTIPAVVTTISGVLTGTWLSRKEEGGRIREKGEDEADREVRIEAFAFRKVTGLFFFGTLLLALGWACSLVFPLNKSLWTSSYVVYTTGLALLTLGFCYYLIDIKGYKRWARPVVIFGVNALALFVFSGIMARMLNLVKFAGPEGKDISLQQWIFSTFYLSWLEPLNASLAYAVSFILLWLFLMWLLYRRQIFIKV
ncbi:lpg1661 family Dot/Icm T4SS effector [soil metagenome]